MLQITGFGHNLYEVLIIPGVIDFILNFNRIEKKGKELNAATRLLTDTIKEFGVSYFDLILGDGLYYTKEKFELCQDHLGAHLFVKTCERLNVVKDVEFYIANSDRRSACTGSGDNNRL